MGVAVLLSAVIAPIAVKYVERNLNHLMRIPNVSTDRITKPIQEYANANSVSILFDANLDVDYYNNLYTNMQSALSEYLSTMQLSIDPDNFSVYEADSGTAWLVDYQTHINSLKNLVTYYLATNIHVVNLSVTIKYPLYKTYYVHGVKQTRFSGETFNLQLPINQQTTDDFSVYISNPLGENLQTQTELPVITSTVVDLPVNNEKQPSTDWFKLPNVNLMNKNKTIVPLGVYNSDGTEPNITYNKDKIAKFYITDNDSILQQGSIDNNYQIQEQNGLSFNGNNKGEDFAIVKTLFNPQDLTNWVNLNKRNISKYLAKQPNIEKSLYASWNNLETMFMVNRFSASNPNQVQRRTYIRRIQSLIFSLQYFKGQPLTATEKDYFWKSFMFSRSVNDNDVFYVSGYPGSSYEGISYVSFKTAAFTDAQPITSNFERNSIEYPLKQQIMSNPYNKNDNYLAPGANLGSGSSGSMVLNSTGQIVGIYWGTYAAGNIGVFTPLFTQNPKTNLIQRLLNYEQKTFVKSTDHPTALTQLFGLMKQYKLI
ncbi:hypothetical protein UREOM_5140 [Ureaplasma sp. OM1]|uniref:DUF31 domain-containing protein n=2 Tax=Ureaplasma ceti TaxID=3119530 RepID=A0ABP9U638_9BACT